MEMSGHDQKPLPLFSLSFFTRKCRARTPLPQPHSGYSAGKMAGWLPLGIRAGSAMWMAQSIYVGPWTYGKSRFPRISKRFGNKKYNEEVSRHIQRHRNELLARWVEPGSSQITVGREGATRS